MSNKIVEKQSQNFLASINNLISNIGLNDVKQSLDSRLGVAILTGTKDGIQHTITLKQQLCGVIQTTSQFVTKNIARDTLIAQVKELSKQGYKQQEIGFMLGISQATVSNYLRK